MPENTLQFKIDVDNRAALSAFRQLQDELSKKLVKGSITGASTEELKKWQAQLDETKRKIASLGFGTRLRAEMQEATANIPVLGRVFTALNGAAGSATTILGGFTVAALGAKKALTDWAAQERAIVGLNAALAATGQLSRSAAVDAANIADAMGRQTGRDQEEWLGVLAQLIRLGNVHASELGREAEAVKNLAGLIGADLSTAAMLYIRAMNGSTETLSKYGIKLDETLSKEQKLAQLREKLGAGSGLLEAQTNTLSGALFAFGDAVGDLFKRLGYILDRGYKLREWFQWWEGALRKLSGSVTEIEPDIEGLNNNEAAARRTEDALQRIGATVESLDLAKPADAAASAYERLNRSLDETIKKQTAIREAQRSLELAALDQQEQIALANPSASKEDQAAIAADFDVRRAQVNKRYAEQGAEEALKAAQQRAANLRETLSLNTAASTEALARRDNAANTASEAKRRYEELHADPKLRTAASRVADLEMQQKGLFRLDAKTANDRLLFESRKSQVAAIGKEIAQAKADQQKLSDARNLMLAAQQRLGEEEATLAAARKNETESAKKVQDAEDAVKLASDQLSATRTKSAADEAEAQRKKDEAKRAKDEAAARDAADKADKARRSGADALAAEATTPAQRRAAREAQRDADLAPLQRQLQTATGDDRTILENEIRKIKAEAAKDLADLDNQPDAAKRGTPTPNIPADRLAQVGLFLGNAAGNTGLLSAAEKTARNTDRIARALENNRRDPSRRGDLTFDGGVK